MLFFDDFFTHTISKVNAIANNLKAVFILEIHSGHNRAT